MNPRSATDVLLLPKSTDQSAEDKEEAKRHVQLGRLLRQVCPPTPHTRQCRAAYGERCSACFRGPFPLPFAVQGILLGVFVITLPFAIPVPPSLQSAYFSLALRTSLRTLSCTCHDVDVEAEAANNLAFVCARGTRTTK